MPALRRALLDARDCAVLNARLQLPLFHREPRGDGVKDAVGLNPEGSASYATAGSIAPEKVDEPVTGYPKRSVPGDRTPTSRMLMTTTAGTELLSFRGKENELADKPLG